MRNRLINVHKSRRYHRMCLLESKARVLCPFINFNISLQFQQAMEDAKGEYVYLGTASTWLGCVVEIPTPASLHPCFKNTACAQAYLSVGFIMQVRATS
jgi:hypothetical protein